MLPRRGKIARFTAGAAPESRASVENEFRADVAKPECALAQLVDMSAEPSTGSVVVTYRTPLGAMTTSVSICSLKTPEELRLSNALVSSASNASALSPNDGLGELDIE